MAYTTIGYSSLTSPKDQYFGVCISDTGESPLVLLEQSPRLTLNGLIDGDGSYDRTVHWRITPKE